MADDIDVKFLDGIGNTPALALAIKGWADCMERGLSDGQLNVWAAIKAFLAYAPNGREMLPVGVLTWDYDPAMRRLFIYQAYVEEEFRGRGVYTALWTSLIAHAVEKLPQGTYIALGTHIQNSAMRAICKKQGMVEEAVFLRLELG